MGFSDINTLVQCKTSVSKVQIAKASSLSFKNVHSATTNSGFRMFYNDKSMSCYLVFKSMIACHQECLVFRCLTRLLRLFQQSGSGNPEELVLNNVTYADEGWYTCVSANSLGVTHSSAYLKVVDSKYSSVEVIM